MHWTWLAYLRTAAGEPLQGTANGTETVAVKLCAATIDEALAILKAHPEISLLVSDVRMPNMDGYALVEQGLALRPNLKVILMTGYAQTPPKLVDAQEIGTLRKPFDIDVLCRRAEDLLH